MSKVQNRSHFVIASLILICLVFAIYIQAVQFQFINYDDDIYVSKNPYVAAGFTKESIRWAFEADLLFETPGVDYWQPLSVLSRMLDVELYGLNPGGHHFTNILFHAANTVLLFLFLASATSAVGPSFFVACIFAAHPLQVDAVAWVTARKDLLAAFFCLLSLLSYHRYAKQANPHPNPLPQVGEGIKEVFPRPVGERGRVRGSLILSAVCFALSLMAKPAFAALPAVFLILDLWPYNRLQATSRRPQAASFKPEAWSLRPAAWNHLIVEKWPFFLLVILSFLTLAKGRSIAVESAFFYISAVKIPDFYMWYLVNFFYPVNLLIRYPEITHHLWMAADSIVIFGGITYFAARAFNKFPYLLAGWLWFLALLIPSVALDFENRYMYLALVGLAVAVCWGLGDLLGRFKIRRAVWAVALSAVVMVLSVLSWISASVYSDSIRLFGDVLRINPNNPRAINNYATALAEMGRLDDAVNEYTKAIWIWPDFSEAHNNLGVALMRQGKDKVAYTHLRAALDIKPDYDKSLNNMAILMRRMGDIEGSIHYAMRSVQLSPELLEGRFNLAVALTDAGAYDDAIRHLEFLLSIDPLDTEALSALGFTYDKKGDYEKALHYQREAIRLRPYFEEAYNNLGNVYAHMGLIEDAMREYRRALALDPAYPEAHNNLAVLLAGLGRQEEAILHFNEALRVSPEYAAARHNLRLALSRDQ